LSLGFDRETFIDQKNDIIADLESALELLPGD